MNLSIIIINYNTCGLLKDCLHSVRQWTTGMEYEIFVVDNASSDDSCGMVESEFPEVTLICNSENRGFAAANNQAIQIARGKYIMLLNSDTVLQNNTFGVMYQFLENHSKAGVCGPLTLNADGTVQNSICPYPTPCSMIKNIIIYSFFIKEPQNKYSPGQFDYSTKTILQDGYMQGACLMIRAEIFKQIGLLDENYFFYLEETDWEFLALGAGWELWFLPEAIITHLRGASVRSFWFTEREIIGKKRVFRQNRYFVKKHYGCLRYITYRLAIIPVILLNLLRRTAAVLLVPKRKKFVALFKLKLAWQLFLISIEYTPHKI